MDLKVILLAVVMCAFVCTFRVTDAEQVQNFVADSPREEMRSLLKFKPRRHTYDRSKRDAEISSKDIFREDEGVHKSKTAKLYQQRAIYHLPKSEGTFKTDYV